MAAPATQCLVRSWRLRFDETGSDRVAGELGTVSQSQRLKDVGAVALDGLETDGQQTEQREVPASCLKTIGQALKSATRTLHCTSASFVGDANADLRFGEFDVDRRGSTWSVPGGVRQTFRAEEVRPTTASVADAIACVRQLHTPIYGLTLHFLPLRPTYWWSVRKKVDRHGEGGASALQACRPEFRQSSHFALVERTSRRFEPTRSANWLLRA